MATTAVLSAAARRCPRSASAIVRREVTGFHKLTIDGCTTARKSPKLESVKSQTFVAAGHRWQISFRPKGSLWTRGYMSVYLVLANGDGRADEPVGFKFSLLDQDGNPVPKYSRSKEGCFFRGLSTCKGFANFIKWKDLEESGCLKDDRFTIRCDITVSRDGAEDADADNEIAAGANAAPARVTVPPSDLHEHLGSLLWGKHGTDVTIDAGGGATYDAHGWLLAARSPVFEAELLAATKKSGVRGPIKVEGVEPRVLKAMLHFMYTDTMPEMAEEEAVAMARGLLAAAHRYKLERLKRMCEETLSKRIDVNTVAGTLAAAKRHGCQALVAMCMEFIAHPGNLRAVVGTEEFHKITANCPALLTELLMNKLASANTPK